jgi:hypothetical protein
LQETLPVPADTGRGHRSAEYQSTVVDRSVPTSDRWRPYLIGAGICVLSWIALLLIDTGLGGSSTHGRTGVILKVLLPDRASLEKQYYADHLTPSVNLG